MKEIELTQGKVTLVDDEDYPFVSKYKWHARRNRSGIWYAFTYMRIAGKKCNIGMHRLILGLTCGGKRDVDHINHNGLDNCRGNLRICSRSQNIMNGKARNGGSSRFRGVYWDKQAKKWHAHIWINQKEMYLGLYTLEECAALAYDFAIMKYHQEFASFNF